MKQHRHGKSPFKANLIRNLTTFEKITLEKLGGFSLKSQDMCTLGDLPEFVSFDNKPRPLILSRTVLEKIISDHGTFSYENLIITTHDWEYVIKNIRNDPDRINLIKKIPKSNNFLLIGAIRNNGFFMLTYFETITTTPRTLKNLLVRGDTLDRSGRTPLDLVSNLNN
jgi:hypothetical protein